MPRKRAWLDANAEEPIPVAEKESVPETLQKIRNTWEFAALMQYIFVFGKAVKIDEALDIEELEMECLNPTPSQKLSDIGLALLKFVSSHRGLTPDIFDEYARRQYTAKAPTRNPFGEEEEPLKFSEFDIFTKIRVLYQLSTWTFHNPDRIRERMPERDSEQTQWRIEPLGWDSQERTYFVLDDDRLYRQTDTPPPKPVLSKPKAKAKKVKKPTSTPTRSSKRRKVSEVVVASSDDEDEPTETQNIIDDENNGLGGAKWECLAITFVEYNDFLDTIQRSRDANEKQLKKRLFEGVLPVIEKKAEEQERKILRKQKELENLQKLATAKRSSRIADKSARQREQEETEAADRKRKEDLVMARKEQDRQRKMEEARESRMLTREQRLKDREVKRILHEEELAKLSRSQSADPSESRFSERHLKAERERREKALERLAVEEEEWDFDCAVCGVHGRNWDDGTHSIACEKCNVWQHSTCHGIKEEEAERDDFHFICASCKKPKAPVKLRFTSSASPKAERPVVASSPSQLANGAPHSSKPEADLYQQFHHIKPEAESHQPPPQAFYDRSASTSALPQQFQPAAVNGTNLQDLSRPAQQRVFQPAWSPSPSATNGHRPPQYRSQMSQLPQQYQYQYQYQRASHSPQPPQPQYQYQRPPSNPDSHYQNAQTRSPVYAISAPPPPPPRSSQMPPHNSYHHTLTPRPDRSPQQPRAYPSPAEIRPSLSATQGNTSIRFSPTNVSRSPSGSYAQTGYAPPTAHSPEKRSSPRSGQPPLPIPSSPPRAALPSPSPAAAAAVSGVGISPIKHDSPRPPSHTASPAFSERPSYSPPAAPPLSRELPSPAGMTLPPFRPDFSRSPFAAFPGSNGPQLHQESRTTAGSTSSIGPSSSVVLPPVGMPTLGPTEGLWRQGVEAPVKKVAEQVQAPLHPNGSTQATNAGLVDANERLIRAPSPGK